MHHAPQVLKQQGHKLTPQRLLIWHILAEGKHLTAEQIHKRVKSEFPGVDLATVYRTLELLVRLGLVQETQVTFGPSRYEATEEIGHNHIICRKCGKVEHFDGLKLQEAASNVCEFKDFDIGSVEVNLSSICNDCLKKGGN
jgi:Fur family ferric uptake transcriptional regulator